MTIITIGVDLCMTGSCLSCFNGPYTRPVSLAIMVL